MFITGPDVVKAVTHEEVGKEELGGAYTHSSKSGVTHFMCETEEETLMHIKELLSFLPSNNMEDAPIVACTDDVHRQVEELQTVIPEDSNMPYDIKDIIEPVVDDQYFFEIMPHFAKNIVIGFARLGGRTVGIVANQPAYLAGVLDIDASDKAARFIRFCDCFNIPIITFEDVPGFLPGTIQEHNRHHTPRSQNRLRLCRSHCSKSNAYHSKSIRRCLYRHVEQDRRGLMLIWLTRNPKLPSWVQKVQ